MRFIKGQKVVCISDNNEWDYIVPNFDEQLKISLNVRKIPKKNVVYEVSNPMELYYKKKCYIGLVGFPDNTFDEKGFIELKNDKIVNQELKNSIIKKSILIINN